MSDHPKMMRARSHMIQSEPFFGALSFRLNLIADPNVDVMATNGKDLRYSPTWVEAAPLKHVIGVIAHEALHCAHGHHLRRGGRDPERWNRAGDYAINPILLKAGFELPDGYLVRDDLTGKSAEKIHAILKDEERQEEQQQSKPQPKPQQGGQPAPGGGGSDGGGAPAKPSPGDAGAADTDQPGEGQGGEAGPVQQPSVGGCGSIDDAKAEDGGDLSPADRETEENEWQIAVAQAGNAAKAQGRLPGSIAEAVKGIKAGKIDWREELRRFFQRAARDDYRMIPPNRRLAPHGLLLPSVRSEALGEIVIAIDTSASVSSTELMQFGAEINAALADTRPSLVHVVYCDTRVNRTETIEADDLPFTLTATGRGGTLFSPVFAWVDEQQIEPVALVYLTDLECSDFGPEPDYPVLWISTGPREQAVPFGDVVPLDL